MAAERFGNFTKQISNEAISATMEWIGKPSWVDQPVWERAGQRIREALEKVDIDFEVSGRRLHLDSHVCRPILERVKATDGVDEAEWNDPEIAMIRERIGMGIYIEVTVERNSQFETLMAYLESNGGRVASQEFRNAGMDAPWQMLRRIMANLGDDTPQKVEFTKAELARFLTLCIQKRSGCEDMTVTIDFTPHATAEAAEAKTVKRVGGTLTDQVQAFVEIIWDGNANAVDKLTETVRRAVDKLSQRNTEVIGRLTWVRDRIDVLENDDSVNDWVGGREKVDGAYRQAIESGAFLAGVDPRDFTPSKPMRDQYAARLAENDERNSEGAEKGKELLALRDEREQLRQAEADLNKEAQRAELFTEGVRRLADTLARKNGSARAVTEAGSAAKKRAGDGKLPETASGNTISSFSILANHDGKNVRVLVSKNNVHVLRKKGLQCNTGETATFVVNFDPDSFECKLSRDGQQPIIFVESDIDVIQSIGFEKLD